MVDDGYIYFIDKDSFGAIYRMKHDGTGIEDVLGESDWISYFNMDNMWIYYVVDGSYLYKMRKDGSEKTKLLYDDVRYITSSDHTLFYWDQDPILNKLDLPKTMDSDGKFDMDHAFAMASSSYVYIDDLGKS